ncbi:MAG TPA: glutamate--tRNA ligase, partial [Alphaproteobacteria bacterium]|nr:glutamate--tRNA ligase [Alphaproteobacteria bacterium]
ARGTAFRCFVTQEELAERRAAAEANAEAARDETLPDGERARLRALAAEGLRAFRSPYRDGARPPSPDSPFVVRLRAPDAGEVVNADLIQGDVRIAADDLDDLVLLRADGNPTYMLSVVVDDHDMGVTHVIRGDDHLTNAARQMQIIEAMDWPVPYYAHLPLLHGEDGAKLSKRHGALGIHEYENLGYLPEAMRNYLLRLGWSHGDDELITTEQAIAWFNLESIGQSPARVDFKKLDNINGNYMREANDARLTREVIRVLHGRGTVVPASAEDRLTAAMPGLKERAKTLVELADAVYYLVTERPLTLDDKAKTLITPEARAHLAAALPVLTNTNWTAPELEQALKTFAGERGVKLGNLAQPLRAALTGRSTSPGIFDVLAVLGREDSLARIQDQLTA